MMRRLCAMAVLVWSMTLCGWAQFFQEPKQEEDTFGKELEAVKLVDFEDAFDAKWGMHEAWDDGKAEISVYDAVVLDGDKKRPYEQTRVVLTQTSGSLPVFNTVTMAAVQGKFAPEQLTGNVRVERSHPERALGAVFGTQGWLGTSCLEVQLDSAPALAWRSGDLQGADFTSRTLTLDWPRPLLLEDQLPFVLRSSCLKIGRGIKVWLVPSMVGQSQVLAPVQVTLARVKSDKSMTVAGRGLDSDTLIVYKVYYPDRATACLTFTKNAPNFLVDYELPGGRTGKLKDVRRLAFWQ